MISGRVMVCLEDLGSRLPPVERKYFFACEMSPLDQIVSKEALANDFCNTWADSSGPMTRLFCARQRLDEMWLSCFGDKLFHEPHADDADMERLIRIPATNGREKFDTVLINLDKLLVDYIDESALMRSDEKGSINKLEKLMRGLPAAWGSIAAGNPCNE